MPRSVSYVVTVHVVVVVAAARIVVTNVVASAVVVVVVVFAVPVCGAVRCLYLSKPPSVVSGHINPSLYGAGCRFYFGIELAIFDLPLKRPLQVWQHECTDITLIPFSSTVAGPVATTRFELATWASYVCEAVLRTQAGARGPP